MSIGDQLYEDIEKLSRSVAIELIAAAKLGLERNGITRYDPVTGMIEAMNHDLAQKNESEMTNGQIIDAIGQMCVMRHLAMIAESRRKQSAERN